MCAELADLAMQLARAAAARALTESAEPQQSPATAEPESMQPAEPQLPQLPQPLPAPRRAASRSTTTHAPKPTDPATLFTRLAAVVPN